MFCCFAFSQSGGSHSLSDWRVGKSFNSLISKGRNTFALSISWYHHLSMATVLRRGSFYQVQIVPLLTLKKSCCQCQIWQKQRCATITFVGPGTRGEPGDTGDRVWGRLEVRGIPSVSSAGDATIPSASLPMALVSFDPCGRIPFGPWRPWLPEPFQGAFKGEGKLTGMFSLCWWQVFLEEELDKMEHLFWTYFLSQISSSLSQRSFRQLLLQVMQGFDFSQMQAGVALFSCT